MYGGKIILRYEDTNPGTERLEYYAAIKVGMDWLGIQFDKIEHVSDNLENLYENAEKLIKSNDAYVCTCKQDTISKNRREMTECECTRRSIQENEQMWHEMFGEKKFKEGQALLRFRGDMKSGNTTMRDPTLFRINTKKHARADQKYRVWPTYDFAGIIFDSNSGVTHAMRSKEFELRKELHYNILDKLGMEKAEFIFFGRLDLEGMPVSKSELKPLIENGKIPWYDDPRLPTLEGLRRRGIRPEAVRKFIISLGLTKNDTNSPFATLEAFNKKIVDSENAEKKIQWVAGNDALQIKAIIPDLLFIDEKFNKDSLLTQEVITESAYSNLKDNAEIQFVRLGYYRKESSHQAIFSHK